MTTTTTITTIGIEVYDRFGRKIEFSADQIHATPFRLLLLLL